MTQIRDGHGYELTWVQDGNVQVDMGTTWLAPKIISFL